MTKSDTLWPFAPCQITFVMSHIICTIPYSAPFHIYYLFWPFLTLLDLLFIYLDFALFHILVSFSIVFYQTFFTWFLHHSFSLVFYWYFMFHSIITVVLMFSWYHLIIFSKFFLWLSYSVLTSDLVATLFALVFTCISCIFLWSLLPFLELCCTISLDLLLTCKRQVTLSSHFSCCHGVCSVVQII